MRDGGVVNRRVFAVVLAAVAGAVAAGQARLNGELAGQTGSPIAAAALSALVGFVILSVAVLFTPSLRAGIAGLPARVRSGAVARWTLLSGVLGGVVLFSQAAAVPLIGVALYSVVLVSAQTASGLGVDARGLGPAGRQPITANRVAGAVLAVVAVVIAAVPDFSHGQFVVGAALVAAAAGLGAALQSAMLGRLGLSAGAPGTAVWVNFVGAAGVLSAALLVATAIGRDWTLPPFGPAWFGGPLGLVIVAIITIAVPVAGVLLVTLALVAGQLLGSLALDVLVPVDGRTPTLWSAAGALLLMAAVTLASRPSRGSRAAAWKDDRP